MITGRYAPSPSGRMHLGNLMCCLLAWLSAKSKGGQVLLRIEDLDTQRCPRAYADAIIDDLAWLGLAADGPNPPGAGLPLLLQPQPAPRCQCAPPQRRPGRLRRDLPRADPRRNRRAHQDPRPRLARAGAR